MYETVIEIKETECSISAEKTSTVPVAESINLVEFPSDYPVTAAWSVTST